MACGRTIMACGPIIMVRLPPLRSASGAMHAKLLRLDPEAFGLPLTALPPKLVGLILVFCSLELGVFAHGLSVLAIQHVRESLAHAQHVRVFALLEVVPGRQILENGHLEAF